MKFEYPDTWARRLDPKLNGGFIVRGTEDVFLRPVAELDLFWDYPPIAYDLIAKNFTVILGQPGTGKSNLVGKVVEELFRYPDSEGNCLPIFLEDFVGEYLPIFEKYKHLFYEVEEITERIEEKEKGSGKHMKTIKIYHTFGKRDAEGFFSGKKSFYFDQSRFIGKREEVLHYIKDFLEEFIRLKRQVLSKERRPHMLVFDEVHNFAPQVVEPTDRGGPIEIVTQYLKHVATDARKYGIPTLYISQRPQMVNKTIIAEGGPRIILPATSKTDFEYCQGLLPPVKAGLLLQMMFEMLHSSKKYKKFYGLCVLPGEFSGMMKLQLKKKKTIDLSSTPGYEAHLGWQEGAGLGQSAN